MPNISPVFKVNYHTDPQNYRSNSVSSNPSKVCERIEYDHLYAHVEEHDLLSKYQSVFSLHFTLTLINVTNEWYLDPRT